MEGRCAAESWADFGGLVESGARLVQRGSGTDVFICPGGEEVHVFTAEGKTLRAVLQLPAAVSDLVVSEDQQLLFVACGTGVYRVNLQLLLHGDSCDAGSAPAELKVSSEFLVVVADGVSSVLLVGSVLLTLCQTDTSWLLSLYNTRQNQPHFWDVQSSFSLPLVSPSVEDDPGSKSALICVYCGDTTTPSPSPAASVARLSHFLLQPLLFKLLFGVEAALSKSPVILCGLLDGRLCFLPLRLPGSRLRVLHSLEQPVVFVGATAAMETDAGFAGCLIALGKQGRALQIRAGKARSDGGGGGAVFTEGGVGGPVACACVDKSRLYYSTGSDLLTVDLSNGSAGREGNEEASRSSAAPLHRPVSLNVSGVVALDQPTRNSLGEIHLLSLSVSGKLQRIRLPVGRQDGSSTLSPPLVGRSVGELLSAIGDVCERASSLKTIIRSKNQNLKQLSQVINISFLLSDVTSAEEKPIRCRASVKWDRLLQRDSLNLTCLLMNWSPYVLERGWMLTVAVLPVSDSTRTRAETSSVSYSFPFRSLAPGESLEVSLPVASAGDASFPVTVTCSLIFSLWSFLGGEGEATSPDMQSDCFSLPLNTLTVDWLHALREIDPASAPRAPTIQSSFNSADAVRAFIDSRQIRCRGGGGASRPEVYSARVLLSSELLRDALRLQKGLESSPQSSCVSLLEWLLSEGCEGVTAAPTESKTDRRSPVVWALAPNDTTVKLTAKEVNLEDADEAAVEVQVESSSLAAVCGVHHAVLRHIQTLLQRACSSKKVPISGLRRALQQAESLRGQISEALSVGMSSGQTNQILLRVYQQLRDAPLVML